MAEHECFIGLYNNCDSSNLVTISDLKEIINEQIRYNAYLKDLGIKSESLYRKEWSLKDFADKRKSTNLTRFAYCPICGKAIDWAAIRRVKNAE